MGNKLLLVVAAVVLMGGLFWMLTKDEEKAPVRQDEINPKTEQSLLTVGGHQISVEVRDDDAERALGLSYRTHLGEDEGMLFIFEQAAMHGFWMKGMEFDLDMIWIRDGVIVDISQEVRAPKNNGGKVATASPKEAADWVLEVVGGWSEQNGVEVGDEVVLVET